MLILIKWLYLKSHSIDKLPAWPHRGKPPGIRDEPVRPCHTITVDTGAFSTDGSASILDAALAQGAQVPFSCQRGECGSCRATVLEGRYERIAPANERSYVTADDELLMCQCRAAGDLRLTFPHWQAPARPPEPRRARVVSRLPLAPGVTQLIVEMEDARPYAWLPGQHVQLLLEDGVRRNFSIANVPVAATPDSLASVATASVATTASPAASSATMSGGSAPNVVERDASGPVRLEFHIRRMPGGVFTDGILPRLAPGDTLTLEGPLGACVWPGMAGATVRRAVCRMACRMAHRMVHTTARTIWCCWPPARDSRACSPS